MKPVQSSSSRLVAALLLVALFPLEIGGAVAAQSVLDVDEASIEHDQPDGAHFEQPGPDAVDLLEVEDDEASVMVAAAFALSSRPILASVSDSPAHAPPDEFERPPRA